MKIQAIDLPIENPLFRDYLQDFDKIKNFYSWNPQSDWKQAIAARSQFPVNRAVLSEILEKQQQNWQAPEASLLNVRQLANSRTFAVVTGQQAGVIGGPLYSFYKIMTAIQRCRSLKEQFPDYQFVPVFWLEIYDNDFEEISAVKILDRDDQIQVLKAEEAPADKGRSVAARKIDDKVSLWSTQMDGFFYDSDFKATVLNRFTGFYDAGQHYGDAFARLMLSFFGEHGLVVMDPTAPEFCPLLNPLYAKIVSDGGQSLTVLEKRSSDLLAAGYPAQIGFRDDQTLLFASDENDVRMRIDRDKSGKYRLNHPEGKKVLSAAELQQSCLENPYRLSPNVALRPIVQDTLLPTIAYIGGPSEINYFAQISALYDYLDIPMPIVQPRHRVTIIEKKIRRLLDKSGAELNEVLSFAPDIIERTVRRNSGQRLAELTGIAKKQIDEALASLRDNLAEIDSGLISGYEKTRGNIENSFEKLSSRIDQVLQERNKIQVQQIERICLNLIPDNSFQERTFSMIQFCVKYGLDLPDQILEILPGDVRNHYLLEL